MKVFFFSTQCQETRHYDIGLQLNHKQYSCQGLAVQKGDTAHLKT